MKLKTHCPRGHRLSGKNLYVNGRRRMCKICIKLQNRRWREQNPEKHRAKSLQFYWQHRDEINKRKRNYRQQNLARVRAQDREQKRRAKARLRKAADGMVS